jgi:hypothetical protein
MALKIRRGTETQRLNIVPAQGELVYDTTQNKLYIGNGSVSGGLQVVGGVIGGSLGSNVNLGGFDITGTGNINITGTITASGTITANGDIILGNADTDNVQFGADINSNIVPNTNSLTLGTSAKPWQTTFAQNISNDSNPVNVLSVLRSNANIIPNATGTLSVGTVSSRFNEMHSVNFYTQNLQIFQNTISSTVTNEDIVLTTAGTGSVLTTKIKIEDSIEAGLTGTNLIKIDGFQTIGSIKYNYNRNTDYFNVQDQAFSSSYTQLVTNAGENITLFEFDPAVGDNLEAFEATIRFKNTSGSQIVKIIGTVFNGTPSIKKIDEISVGVAPIASFTSAVVSNVYSVMAVTNTATTAGEIINYQIKITVYNTI